MATKGKHPSKALTAVAIRALSSPGRYADGNGLYVVVDPSGAKRWVLRTVIIGKRCDIGLGGISLVTLAEARELTAQMRKSARSGGDPLAERRKAVIEIPTFEEAAKKVHAEHSGSWKNPKHAAQWINTLTEYAFPIFGNKRVDGVDTNDVKAALLAIWQDKPETAKRVRQRIKMVFDWCKALGFRPGDNPCDGLTKVLPKQTIRAEHHAALAYADVPAFIRLLRKSDASESARLAFELLILTATRTNEILAAQWGEFDLEAALWTIPASRMKAKREHRVPLSPRSVEILKKAKKLSTENQFVFPGIKPKKPLSNMTFLMAVRRLGKDITVHGFRSSFRDWAAECTNFPSDVCEAALAHAIKNKAEAAYNRTDLFNKRADLMAAWAVFSTSKHIPQPTRKDQPQDRARARPMHSISRKS